MLSGGSAVRRVVIGLLVTCVGASAVVAATSLPAEAKTKKPATVGGDKDWEEF